MNDTVPTNTNGLPTVHRPCPPWCEIPTGHEWTSGSGWEEIDERAHAILIGEIDGASINVSVDTLESSTKGGPSTFTPVVITVDSRPGDAELNPGQARQLASLLVLAAAQVEAL